MLCFHHIFQHDVLYITLLKLIQLYVQLLMQCFPGNRLSDFLVVLSDIAPPIVNGEDLDGEGFKLCAQYSGALPASETGTIICTSHPSGRYVYIYMRQNEVLTLCEVQVFEKGERNPVPYLCLSVCMSA